MYSHNVILMLIELSFICHLSNDLLFHFQYFTVSLIFCQNMLKNYSHLIVTPKRHFLPFSISSQISIYLSFIPEMQFPRFFLSISLIFCKINWNTCDLLGYDYFCRKIENIDITMGKYYWTPYRYICKYSKILLGLWASYLFISVHHYNLLCVM